MHSNFFRLERFPIKHWRRERGRVFWVGRCLAVSNSYPPEKLTEADKVVSSLESVTPEKLESLF